MIASVPSTSPVDFPPPAAGWDDRTILITGGTGSFGRRLVETLVANYRPAKVIIFSRDELKQHEMRLALPESRYPSLRYFIGDIRDRQRLYRAFDGVDIVVHAAALKQVPTAEYNPLETINTNVLGSANVIDAAIDRDVQHVIALSTDKAASPINLYGASKLCADKLFVAANSYSGRHKTKFTVVRYGNVVGSRGSVIPLFLQLADSGRVPITDPRMTRFWITLPQGVRFVLESLAKTHGGEIFVPKIPSMRITDLARAIAPKCTWETVGIRTGEKLHEVMITEDDARHTVELDDEFVILPTQFGPAVVEHHHARGGVPCPEGFSYTSDANDRWLSIDDLRAIAGLPPSCESEPNSEGECSGVVEPSGDILPSPVEVA